MIESLVNITEVAAPIEGAESSLNDNAFLDSKMEGSSLFDEISNLDIKKDGEYGDLEQNHNITETSDRSLSEIVSKESLWSHEITDSIRSYEEAKVYMDAGLEEGTINDRPCLQNPQIDWEQRNLVLLDCDVKAFQRGELPLGFGQLDSFFTMSNMERALQGLSPLDKNGQAFELHHVGQRMDSPLAELTSVQHRGNGNDIILHDKTAPSQIDRGIFQLEKQNYWQSRAQSLT